MSTYMSIYLAFPSIASVIITVYLTRCLCLFCSSTVLYQQQQRRHVLYQHLCHHDVFPSKRNRKTTAATTTRTRSDNGNRNNGCGGTTTTMRATSSECSDPEHNHEHNHEHHQPREGTNPSLDGEVLLPPTPTIATSPTTAMEFFESAGVCIDPFTFRFEVVTMTSLPPSATGTPQQQQPERDPTMAMAIGRHNTTSAPERDSTMVAMTIVTHRQQHSNRGPGPATVLYQHQQRRHVLYQEHCQHILPSKRNQNMIQQCQWEHDSSSNYTRNANRQWQS